MFTARQYISLVYLVPSLLYAQQSVCTLTEPTGHSIIVSDTRSYWMSRETFEQRLLNQARIRLIQEVSGLSIYQNTHIRQSGGKSVTINMESNIHQTAAGNFDKECYRIVYRGRKGTIFLTAVLLPTPKQTNIPAVTFDEDTTNTPVWKALTPFYIAYLILFLV